MSQTIKRLPTLSPKTRTRSPELRFAGVRKFLRDLHARASRRAETKERGSSPTIVCCQKGVELTSGNVT